MLSGNRDRYAQCKLCRLVPETLLVAVMRVFSMLLAAFFGLHREGLSPGLGVALTPRVSPRCQATGRVHADSFIWLVSTTTTTTTTTPPRLAGLTYQSGLSSQSVPYPCGEAGW